MTCCASTCRPPAREEPPPPEPKPIPKNLDSTALTLAEFWLDDVESYLETLAPGSRKEWRQIWRDHIAPVLGDLPLDAIRRPEILKLRRKIKPLATATRNAIISKVRKLLDMAAELGHLAEAPRIASEKGLPCKETPAYTAEEIELLVATARTLSPEHVALVLVMTDTCLRVSEVCALRWGDVDLARGLITVRHNFSGGEPWRPKGKKVKPVGITPDLEAALRDLPRRGSRDRVFVRDETGQRHTRSSIMWRMGQVQTRAGLPVWTPHKFRHSGVTAMADAGADVWTIMAQARHADMKDDAPVRPHARRRDGATCGRGRRQARDDGHQMATNGHPPAKPAGRARVEPIAAIAAIFVGPPVTPPACGSLPIISRVHAPSPGR